MNDSFNPLWEQIVNRLRSTLEYKLPSQQNILEYRYHATFLISDVASMSFFLKELKLLWPLLDQRNEELRFRRSDMRGDLKLKSSDGVSS